MQEDLANFSNDNRIKTDNIWRAIAGLGLSPLPRTEGGNNVAYSIEHFDEKILDEDGYPGHFEDQTYEVDGIEYMVHDPSSAVAEYEFCGADISQATGAYYRFTVNQPQGGEFSSKVSNIQYHMWQPPDFCSYNRPELDEPGHSLRTVFPRIS